tara:strand:- start:25932 stop:26489 length:558 start_codon:yes stop_codon:yes gene_type:complete
MALEELLIRGNPDGTIRGAHAVDYVEGRPGSPRALSAEDWPALAADVNALLSGRILELETEAETAKSEAEAAKAEATSSKSEAEAAKADRARVQAELDALLAEPVVEEVVGVTKLAIKRRLDALEVPGKWKTLKTVLTQLSEDVQDEWELAQNIQADDPLFLANAEALQVALDLTPEQMAALLQP